MTRGQNRELTSLPATPMFTHFLTGVPGPERLRPWPFSFAWMAVVLLLAHLPAARSQSPGTVPWRYTLVHGATWVDDCPICGRPTILLPLRGTFDLQWVREDPLFQYYALENIRFEAGGEGGPRYLLTGRGEYRFGGEVALTRRLTLDLKVDNGTTVHLDSAPGPVQRPWPMLQAESRQTNGSLVQEFSLNLAAAPFHELWFSTQHGLTSGTTPPPFTSFPESSLLSKQGRAVSSNFELTRSLGMMPIVPDLGLDAVTVQPGGEIAFSTRIDTFSERLGPLSHGDILSNQGRVLWKNNDLIAAFQPMPPSPPTGLDALHFPPGEKTVYFSTTTRFFSEKLGRSLQRGDLLSTDGTVIKSHASLLTRFQPKENGAPPDFGLDAVFVWPSGEVWFSTEESFDDLILGPIGAGDLLSDGGYVVFKNLDLVGPFSPLEDLADFGLDALCLVTDAFPPPATPPIINQFDISPPATSLHLEWSGSGRFFQVMGAPNAAGPYVPVSPVQCDSFFDQSNPLKFHPEFYFRVRQW
jgi:hypothetical protein